jgi:aminopeptidase N
MDVHATVSVSSKNASYRGEFDNTILPVEYRIILEPDQDRKLVYGKCAINLKILEPRANIRLHALNIKIHRAKIKIQDLQLVTTNVDYNIDKEIAEIKFDDKIPSGEARLSLQYTAKIFPGFRGIYEIPLTRELNERMSIIDFVRRRKGFATHFEPCDARTAFPCFDEPQFKAKFQLSVIVPNDLIVVSNMPLEKEEPLTSTLQDKYQNYVHPIDEDLNDLTSFVPSSSKKKVTFQQTPLTSTYLNAFVASYLDWLEKFVTVSYFDETEQSKQDTIKLRVYTLQGKAEEGAYVLNMAEKALTFYVQKLRIGYPLPKMDIIGVENMDALAMENWGALIFVNDFFLVNNDTPFQRKQRIARLVCHEVGHQWFGNLVTIKEWQYLWLKEGFARYMEYYLVNNFFPEWNYWQHFLFEIYSTAMKLDESFQSHPVQVFVEKSRDIKEIFDSISYGKAASALRMLANYIGEETLWKGMSIFINKFKFGVVATEDLWEVLREVSGVEIASLMDGWIKNAGHPVLHISREISSEKNSTTFTIIQELCKKTQNIEIPNSKKDHEGKICYDIPILIKCANDTKVHTFIIDRNRFTLTITHPPSPKWIKLNWGHTGVFRYVCNSPF